jgi:hypothetical protein
MNSTAGLSKMIMLQHVPMEEIQKWNAADMLQMLLWSAGAAVGGNVVGHWGVIGNFFCTAAVQFGASIPLIILYLLDPTVDIYPEEEPTPNDDVTNNSPSIASGNEDLFYDPEDEGGVSFQDCQDVPPFEDEATFTAFYNRKGRYSNEKRSPATSEATNATKSIDSSDSNATKDSNAL